ncbi:unnamed protein product [Closterium sp. NIES-53]
MKMVHRQNGEYFYVLENLNFAADPRERVRAMHRRVTLVLGAGVALDAAQAGSRGHRDQSTRTTLRTTRATSLDSQGKHAFKKRGGVPGPGMVKNLRTREWEGIDGAGAGASHGLPARGNGSTRSQRVGAKAGTGARDGRASHGVAATHRGDATATDRVEIRSRLAKRSCMQSFMVLEATTQDTPAEHATAGPGSEEESWTVGPALTVEEADRMKQMLKQHRRAFAYTLKELGRSKIGEMKIELTSDTPTFQPKRRMTRADEEVCKELYEAGLIRPSTSEYAAATVVAAQKDATGEILSRRMCGDY